MAKDEIGELSEKRVWQIVSILGEGQLRDNSEASKRFRSVLTGVDLPHLRRYVEECLDDRGKEDKARSRTLASALQDVVNELGRRLGFIVENGRYKGVSGESGHDGLWRSPDHSYDFIIEVKARASFPPDRNSLERYLEQLLEQQKVTKKAVSFLIIYGGGDRAKLEANVDEKWSRIVSIEELFRLLQQKDRFEKETSRVFQALLKPNPPLTSFLDAFENLKATAKYVKGQRAMVAEEEPQTKLFPSPVGSGKPGSDQYD